MNTEYTSRAIAIDKLAVEARRDGNLVMHIHGRLLAVVKPIYRGDYLRVPCDAGNYYSIFDSAEARYRFSDFAVEHVGARWWSNERGWVRGYVYCYANTPADVKALCNMLDQWCDDAYNYA